MLTKPNSRTQAEAEAKFKRRQDQERDGRRATAEYEAAAVTMREKTARLRALRLAKQAADAKAAAEKKGATDGKKKGR
jgi:hypothetical protein